MIDSLRNIYRRKALKKAFLQAKYDNAGNIPDWAIIVSSVTYCLYWFADCILITDISKQTLLPRVFILLPMLLFLILRFFVKHFRVMSILSYAVLHSIFVANIFSAYHLPVQDYVGDGLLLLQASFLIIGLYAPFYTSLVCYLLFFVELFVANMVFPLPHFQNTVIFSIPVFFAVTALNFIVEKNFLTQYTSGLKFKSALVLDQLTKLYSRKKLDEIVDPNTRELLIETEEGQDISFVLGDLDGMRKINDDLGLQKGDAMIRYAADVCRKHIASGDTVFRWDGNEFAIICIGKNTTEAGNVAEAIREELETKDNGIAPITISFGVSSYKGNFDETVANAARSMYAAKEVGRNNVVCGD